MPASPPAKELLPPPPPPRQRRVSQQSVSIETAARDVHEKRSAWALVRVAADGTAAVDKAGAANDDDEAFFNALPHDDCRFGILNYDDELFFLCW